MAFKGEIVEKYQCCSVEWKIKDFFSVSPYVFEKWFSPSFHLANALWNLELSPNSRSDPNSPTTQWISIRLTNKENSENEIHKVSYTLGVKTYDGAEFKSLKHTSVFSPSFSLVSFTKVCEMKELQREKRKLFPDGVVTFFCRARHIGEENGVDAESQTDNRGDFCRVSENFKDFFLNDAAADVMIKVKGKELRAHSQILSARSPVLAAMFRHDTKEKNSGVVEIPEYDSDSFRQFLMFLYSGQAPGLSLENVTILYAAADKYDMEDLKPRCSEFMKENMSVDSICRFLSLAITYEDKDLIEFSSNFFAENLKKIIVTVEWMSFVKQYPEQSNALIIRAMEYFVPR